MEFSELKKVLDAAPVGTRAEDEDGDVWSKNEDGTWFLDGYGFNYSSVQLADTHPFIVLQWKRSSEEILTKGEILAALNQELSTTSPSVEGNHRRVLINSLMETLGLKSKKKVVITLEIEVDEDIVAPNVDAIGAAHLILDRDDDLANLIKNVEVIK